MTIAGKRATVRGREPRRGPRHLPPATPNRAEAASPIRVARERTDMNNNPTHYLLAWPTGWPRTRAGDRERSRFMNARAGDDQLSMSDATSRPIRECRLLGAANVIVSTNVAVRGDGLPYARQKTPEDPRVLDPRPPRGPPRGPPPTREDGYRRVTSHGAGDIGAPLARPNARDRRRRAGPAAARRRARLRRRDRPARTARGRRRGRPRPRGRGARARREGHQRPRRGDPDSPGPARVRDRGVGGVD